MTSGWQERVELERQWLQGLRADVPALAQTVAEDVVDALESEIDKETEDGLIWDVADGLQRALLLNLSDQFEKAVEQAVLKSMDARSRQLAAALGGDWAFDTDRAALDNLRKSLRLVQRLLPYLERIFQRAKPGVLTQLFRAVGDDLDRMKKQWQDDGERLRSVFRQERPALQKEIVSIAEELIQRLRLYYQQALEQVGVG